MPIYLYALVSGPDAALSSALSIVGLDEKPIRGGRVPGTDATAIVSDLAGAAPDLRSRTIPSLEAHDRVTDSLIARGLDVIPARFGQTLPTEAELVGWCVARAPSLGPVWARVTGCVEMSVSLRPPPATSSSNDASGRTEAPYDSQPLASSTGMGRAYLENRARSHRELRRTVESTDRWRDAFRQRTRGIVRGEVERVTREPLAVTLSHLVERAGLATYRQVIRDIEPNAGFALVSGPHAPYSFASSDDTRITGSK
jgi:hypothetical protein